MNRTLTTAIKNQLWPMLVVFGAVLPMAILAGCSLAGPDYTPIEPSAPAHWHSGLQGGVAAGSLAGVSADWWRTLDDPLLASLIERSANDNLDVKKALLRIEEVRSQYGASRSALFPSLDAQASARRSQTSGNVESGTVNNFFHVGIDAGWELDFFGGIRRALEAAQADLDLQQEIFNGMVVSLQAEIALNYLELRTFQARLEATQQNLAAQKETYELNLSRFEAGLIDELAVQQANYNLEQTRAQIPALQTGIEQTQNRLAILLGQEPGALHDELVTVQPIPTIPVSVAIGIPAETLRQRPDIRSAERELARQTALVGVATSDLYPKFRLSGTVGLESLAADRLFESASRIWGIGPAISWNIFDAGKIRRNIEVQTARQEQALVSYQMTVLKAQEEVENSLVAFAKEQLRREALDRATSAARRASQIAKDKYDAGLVDFSNVLDAQRSLSAFEDQLAQSSGTVTANLIRLYKALGGGWQAVHESH